MTYYLILSKLIQQVNHVFIALVYIADLSTCCLTIERTLAVFWPFASKRLLGTRFTIILLLIVAGSCVLAFLPLDYLVYNLRFFPTYAQVP